MKKLLLIPSLLIAASSFAQNGITWQSPINVATSAFGNQHPRIMLDRAGNPLVLFGYSTDDKANFSRWNGSAFTTPVTINPASAPVFAQAWAGPDIASKGDTVYIVYKKTPETEDTNHIFVRRSFDGGKTFATPTRVDNINNDVSRFPTVTVDLAGHPIVAFMRFNPSFGEARWVVAKSNDFGNTFSADVLASNYSGGDVCDCCPATITSSGNNMAMLYRDNLSNIRDTWVGISTNNGTSFPNGIAVDKQNWMLMACPSSGPDGVIIGDTVYSVFMSKYAVYANKNSISGLNSSAGKPITMNNTGISEQNYPRIANFKSAIAQVWKQVKNSKAEIGLSFTTDIRKGFPMNYEVVASSTSNSIANADVALENGTIHLVWQDDNSGTVKYRKGTFTPTTGLQKNIGNTIFSVLPNPANDQITIQTPAKLNYTIYNNLGQPVYTDASNETGTITIDVSNWPANIYFIKTNSVKESFSMSFLICH